MQNRKQLATDQINTLLVSRIIREVEVVGNVPTGKLTIQG